MLSDIRNLEYTDTMEKVILITGSSRGIGAKTAELARQQNMRVVLHGKNESIALKELAQRLNSPYVTFDVTDEDAVKYSVEQIESQYGPIEVLVNCAGIVLPATTIESTRHNWLHTYETNVIGPVNLVKHVAPKMLSRESGTIVNVSSIHGHNELASEGVAAYSASKSALLNLTASWAREFAPYIRVNAISPGFTITDMSNTWPASVWKQAKSNLMQREATTTDVANAILFFTSDKATFITGQSLIVDGGYSLSNR